MGAKKIVKIKKEKKSKKNKEEIISNVNEPNYKSENCFLCDLYEKRKLYTRIYGESTNCIVVESFNKEGSKKRIMSVLKKHIDNPSQKEIEEVVNVLQREANKMDGSYEVEPFRAGAVHYHRHAKF